MTSDEHPYNGNMPAAHLPNTVKVAVSVGRAIVVDYDVDTFNINTTTEDICGDEDTLLKRLEGSVPRDAKHRS